MPRRSPSSGAENIQCRHFDASADDLVWQAGRAQLWGVVASELAGALLHISPVILIFYNWLSAIESVLVVEIESLIRKLIKMWAAGLAVDAEAVWYESVADGLWYITVTEILSEFIDHVGVEVERIVIVSLITLHLQPPA